MTAKTKKARKAPPPGSYTGTVDGFPAVFVVCGGEFSGVEAVWYEPAKNSLNGFRQCSNAWDVNDGKFVPVQSGNILKVVIKAATCVPPEDAA